jgi:CRP/FNR family transcriptional regulator, cyclic AMP receptor protein
MFAKIFNKKSTSASDSKSADERMRSISGSASASRAAEMLTAPTALMQLSRDEGKVVVSFMAPKKIAEGTTFMKEGDARDTGYMMLLLDGEVTIESITVSRTEPVTVTVLGPGSLIGEMGLLDGEPRSASCTATTDINCAILTRDALEKLMNEDPRVGAKLMMAVSLRIAERMRDTADKLKLYAQLVQAMQQEIDNALPS